MKTYWLLIDEDNDSLETFNSLDAAEAQLKEYIDDGEYTSGLKVVRAVEEYRVKVTLERVNDKESSK